jgi:transcriptional regulator GlxA family with amidase domain
MDLCLYLVEKYHSNKTATNLANLLVIDKRRDSQKSYKTFSTIFLFDDEEIKKSIKWMKNNLKEQISNVLLAKRLEISERASYHVESIF